MRGLIEVLPVIVYKSFKHGKGVLRLIHGHHVSSIIDSEEVEVSELAHLASWSTFHSPRLVSLSVKFVFVTPFGGCGPGLTTAPVADEVFIARVDKDVEIGVVEHPSDLRH